MGNDLTLAKAMSIARTVESVTAQEKVMTGTVVKAMPELPDTLRARSERPRQSQAPKCYRCGSNGHAGTDPVSSKVRNVQEV